MRGHNTAEADPFARLTETHRRLEQRLEDLERAALDLRQGIGPKAALEDIFGGVGFLGRGARRHVEDEESTLFPRLRALMSADPTVAATLEPVLARLGDEHVAHRAIEDELTAMVQAWGDAPPPAADVERLVELTMKLKAVYAEHIAHEERDLFPAAKAALSAEEIAEMGREMMDRRPDRGKDKPR